MPRYTPEEIKFVHDNYMQMTDTQMGEVIGRSQGAIGELRKRWGLGKHVREIFTRTFYDKYQYQYIRIAPGKWIPLHRHIWMQAHGEIPKGCHIIFKDRDTMNCTLENLELITKVENILRNVNPKKQAASIKRHWNYCRIKEIYGIKTVRHGKFPEIT